MKEDKKSKLPAIREIQTGSIFNNLINNFEEDLSLYNQVMNQIDPEKFELLNKKKQLSVAGISSIDGGIFEEKLSFAGRGSSKNDVFTKKLIVAGSSTFNGMVGASEGASIAGKSLFRENALFGGRLSVAGSASFNQNLVVSGGARVAGRVMIEEYLLADSPVRIEGSMYAQSIRSNDQLMLEGKIYVQEDVIARDVILKGIRGTVNGNLLAEKIETDETHVSKGKQHDLKNPRGLISYLADIMSGIVRGKRKQGLLIEGDVIADEVNLNNVKVNGNVYAKNVIIGDDVQILGKIHYTESYTLPESNSEEFEVVEGFPESLETGKDQ